MIYTVPLIQPNLRKNETIVQIADSLNHLSKTIDEIMLHIENKIDNSSKKLNEITGRLEIVENNISKLHEVKKAVQVFSSSKYPASDKNLNYTSAFPVKTDMPIVRHKVSTKFLTKKDEPLEKLHIYHVQLGEVPPQKVQGLGSIPRNIQNVNDLLLYGTGRNLYRDFKASDSSRIQQNATTKSTENKIEIGTAPDSIKDRTYPNLPAESYFYSPDLGEVPALDVPVDLPDLPGIADDVRYKDEGDFTIAPSIIKSPSTPPELEIPDGLPEIIPDGLPEIVPERPPETPIKETVEHKKTNQSTEIIQETKPPTLQIQKNDDEVHVKFEVKEVPKLKTKKQELPNIPDARASLMEAIRQAGGRKTLKAVQSIEENVPKKEQSGGGDLMADLHAKLAMRRKGISGTQKNNENVSLDSRDALNLMSSLIPPPNEVKDAEETDLDDDWEP